MSFERTIFITGGYGFIGSHFVRLCLQKGCRVINLDALTYAASQGTLKDIEKDELRYHFQKGQIQDRDLVRSIFSKFKPSMVINFAAETHVDRSIDSPRAFIDTNILGAFTLLEESYSFFNTLTEKEKENFKFLHISTDEVFGSCPGDAYKEDAPYNPSSPYAASKASADLLIKSFYHTYNFPVLITNCTNNYGPYQFPEKLIPLMVIRAHSEQPLPIYGSGMQIRDWLYVEDHVEAIWSVLQVGKTGNTYNIAGLNGEVPNKVVVEEICTIFDNIRPRQNKASYRELITYVTDRPGHDFRYALNIEKIKRDIRWSPKVNFREGLKKTVGWYLENDWWWQEILAKGYQAERLGLRK